MDLPASNRQRAKLERRNALKYSDYDASSSAPLSAPQSPAHRSMHQRLGGDLHPSSISLDSFRVQGEDGLQRIEQICKSLGLSGPDDLSITIEEFRARKAKPRPKIEHKSPLFSPEEKPLSVSISRSQAPSVSDTATFNGRRSRSDNDRDAAVSTQALAPPPPRAWMVGSQNKSPSTWDIVKSFGPEEEAQLPVEAAAEEEEGDVEDDRGEAEASIGEAEAGSSSSGEETVCVVSAGARFKVQFRSWIKGHVLGSGSFGTVYEGISDDGYFFAVKEVSLVDQGSNAKQSISQLEQEVALLSQFEHENIVQYLGTDKEADKLYIFLELVTQGSLASLYRKYNLRDTQVRAYTRQILTGLKYLHEKNVMHRDIKCANILVDAHGLIKLADFGLAKETSKLDELKSCKGSAYWMAPEVVNPRKTYWLPADIWSLGCTVIEMLTRRPPFGGLEWQKALWKIGHGEPPPFPSTLSRDAKDFIQQCLQVEPANRPSAKKSGLMSSKSTKERSC
ncbi:hypothetical protein SUGI_0822910 [Cryptomeria japonica]|nr:hypothetical protein SUGI_0822910 [Cryptomeria japonica]